MTCPGAYEGVYLTRTDLDWDMHMTPALVTGITLDNGLRLTIFMSSNL